MTDPDQPPWRQNGAHSTNLARCTPLEFIRVHCEASRKKLLTGMASKPESFQREVLELLFESDQRD
eukprot:3717808-Rhodomonas_salina.1